MKEGVILLEHGSGGQASARLLREVILPHLGEVPLLDSAVLKDFSASLAFTTDSFVVDPIFFPGGDIGSLAVHGTVNDLAMVGATPLFLSVAFILEEGFPLKLFSRVVASLGEAARKAGVRVVCGDTKVVPKGKGDKIFINTSGIGILKGDFVLSPSRIKEGDRVIVSGPIAEHGLCVLAAREDLGLEGLKSDSQPLHRVTEAFLSRFGPEIKVLRDPTRGGVAAVLHEFAEATGLSFILEEEKIPLRPEVKAGCELLGLDPLYLACEGRLVAVVTREIAEEAASFLRSFPEGQGACVVGEVTRERFPLILQTCYGGLRPVPPLAGEPLPRIC